MAVRVEKVSSQYARAASLQIAVAFLAAKGRLNPYLPGDDIPSPEKILKLADRFATFIDTGTIVTDYETIREPSTP